MIIILKNNASPESVEKLDELLKEQGLKTNHIQGANQHIIGLIGDTSAVDMHNLYAQDCIEEIKRVQEPYKKANRKFHPDDTVIEAGGRKIGDGSLQIIAGPCSVETEEQILTTAHAVKEAGATMLRGGAFKPRTSPYSFQGLGEKGLDMLISAAREEKLPVVTELMSADKIGMFLEKKVDLIQIGARNMQNFDLLKAVGRLHVPVLLKRGMSATIEEWLMSAEYIMSEGNHNVILCERGIRTFEKATRNTLDLSAVAAVKRMSHLPIIVDPSHATGRRWMVESMAMAAIAAGADGIMCEVHNDPEHAWCDGAESITPETFDHMMGDLRKLAPIVGREI